MKKAIFAALIVFATFPAFSCEIYNIFNPDIFNAPEAFESEGYQYSFGKRYFVKASDQYIGVSE